MNEPDTSITDLLHEILGEQQRASERLDHMNARLAEVEERAKPAAGVTPLPEGTPEPGVHANGTGWDAMDEEQRQAWIRAHDGLIREQEPETETISILLPSGVGAEFPKPPESIKSEWAETAPAIFENLPATWGLSIEDAVDAYTKGGPLWLAAFGQAGHDWIMQLPYGWRQRMVEGIGTYAPGAAAELGRDILRKTADESNTWAYDQALDWADARKQGVVVKPGPGGAS